MEAPLAQKQVLEVATAAALDSAVVERVRGGDRALFEVLMRRHNRRVYRALRAVLGRARAGELEDAMQQTWLRAFAALDAFEGASSFATWVTRIAVNEGLDRLRRKDPGAGAPLELVDASTLPSHAARADDRAESREALAVLERAIDALPTAYRAVVMLRDVEQLSTAEAADALGITEEAVRVRLHRARRALHQHLEAQLGQAAREAFPFGGSHCDGVVAAVMAAIGVPPGKAG